MASWSTWIRLQGHQILHALAYIPFFLMGIPNSRAVSAAAIASDSRVLWPPNGHPQSYPTDPQQEMKYLSGDKWDQAHLATHAFQDGRWEHQWCQKSRQKEEMGLLRCLLREMSLSEISHPHILLCLSSFTFFYTTLEIFILLQNKNGHSRQSVFICFKEYFLPFSIHDLSTWVLKATFHCHLSPLKSSI